MKSCHCQPGAECKTLMSLCRLDSVMASRSEGVLDVIGELLEIRTGLSLISNVAVIVSTMRVRTVYEPEYQTVFLRR